MRVHAWLRVKNEVGIIADVVTHLLEIGCAKVCVLDTGSEDGTVEVARQAGAEVVRSRLPFYHEAAERYAAIVLAKAGDPDWIVQLDADEYIDGSFMEELEWVSRKQPCLAGLRLRLYDFRFCDAAPEEMTIAAPLPPNRRWVEPFYRRLLRVYRPLDELCIIPFVEHHTALVAIEPDLVGDMRGCTLRHYGLCRSAEDFERKRHRYTTQHRGRAYDMEWRHAHAIIPREYLREWPLGEPPPADAIEVHVGSNIAKRDVNNRNRIVSVVW